MSLNSIMTTNYVTDYHNLIYNFYSKEYAAWPCTYYRLDYKNSIKDDRGYKGGTYELLGELSGYKWHKIHCLSILFSESITSVSSTTDERGKNYELNASFVIPSTFGLEPLYHDIIIFPHSLRPNKLSKYPSFEVTEIEKATFSSDTMYKITAKSFWATENDIDKQIIDQYIFIDYFKNIYPLTIGYNLLQTMNNINIDLRFLYDNYLEKQSRLLSMEQ